jgi:hypothetical protein
VTSPRSLNNTTSWAEGSGYHKSTSSVTTKLDLKWKKNSA